ncbi:4'-phosphopantetheinyl transferase family protein [Paraburkholderia sp. BCC1886]|uniref:4'-phosphopantetheinyl transferase family protein n=1 Tax=Paraburkholderia sp. BCC1886 TaxID=2562670 RepID=UPI001183829C|nr:4'-phosphopantetheinyl transferase superfamily protein [Paraburkholderia sp. BCC1886]
MPSIQSIPLQHEGPADIALSRVDCAFDRSLDDAAFAALSDDELARARRFLRHEDTIRFASVRAALREQLAAHLRMAARDISFSVDTNGRPYLVDTPACDFNVSHAGGYGLIALSRTRRVGVDIERLKPGFDWRSISRLTLDAEEIAWIERLDKSARDAAFYDAWVAKEALVKTTGAGIAHGLQHLTVLPREGREVTLRKQIPADMQTVAAHWITAPAGYAACLAWSR